MLNGVCRNAAAADSTDSPSTIGRLGLSIVWDLARLHGGSMHAFSAGAGTGATFTLALPLLDSGDATPTG